MKAYTCTEFLPRDQWKTVELPDDLSCMPISCENGNVSINYSETVKKWYVLYCDAGEARLLASGAFLDCVPYTFNLDYDEVPFLWGEPIKNDRFGIEFIPIWENLEGETYTDSDGWEWNRVRRNYRIIRIYKSRLPHDNLYQMNHYSGFEVHEYGENLVEMIKDLEMFTDKKF